MQPIRRRVVLSVPLLLIGLGCGTSIEMSSDPSCVEACEGRCDSAGRCATGELEWAIRLGGTGSDAVYGVAAMSDAQLLIVGDVM